MAHVLWHLNLKMIIVMVLLLEVASERLMRRNQHQRFLIVFSDGEPSAFNYSQDGIIDTYEAVEMSRKFGIEVFNVF